MKQVMEHLLALQTLELDTKRLTPERKTEILRLREKVSAPILSQFGRLMARGKKGVAIARNGACSECHLRLPSGTIADLAYTNEVHLCVNCGRYLYLPEDKPLSLTNSPPANAPAKKSAKRTRKKVPVHVA